MIRKIIQATIALIILLIGYYKFSGSEYQKDLIIYGFVGLVALAELLIEFIIINRKRLGLIFTVSGWG
jgi:membrane-bound ClpP family serine protease